MTGEKQSSADCSRTTLVKTCCCRVEQYHFSRDYFCKKKIPVYLGAPEIKLCDPYAISKFIHKNVLNRAELQRGSRDNFRHIFFILLYKKLSFDSLLELSHCDSSNAGSDRMYLLRNLKIYPELSSKLQLI